jgi:hypothetical protein
MGEQMATIEIPGNLFQLLKQKADFMHRPVEDLVIQTLAIATPPVTDLPPELVVELDALLNYSDDALWAATKPSISPTERARLEQLNILAGERPLSETEKNEQTQLLKAWQRSLARRARAFAILQLRGHPLPTEDELKAEVEKAG